LGYKIISSSRDYNFIFKMKNISPKFLETNLESDLIPKTVEIVEITTDRFALTENSFATLTES
jgi:hypothetical protein